MISTISVIIPVYNAEKYIIRTVENINSSTIVPNEILLIDDGSLDKSLSICRELSDKYSNVKTYNKINGGIADTRNYGLKKAQSDYVCFMDQDDYVDSEMYEKVLKEINNNNSDVVIVSTGQIVNDKKIPFEILKNGRFKEEEIRDKLLMSFLFRGYNKIERYEEYSLTSSIWKCVIKRSLLQENDISFKRFISYEDDYIMMCSLLCYAHKVTLMDYIGYYWLVNGESESHRINYIDEYEEKTLKLREYMISMLRKIGLNKSIIEVFDNQFLFEKTIDVIANAYSGINSTNKKSRIEEIEGYIDRARLFEMNLDSIRPLDNFFRLKVLYFCVKKKNKKLLIKNVAFFLSIENKIHSNLMIMKLLNWRKSRK